MKIVTQEVNERISNMLANGYSYSHIKITLKEMGIKSVTKVIKVTDWIFDEESKPIDSTKGE